MLVPWKKSYYKPRQCIKKQRYYFANKGPYSQTMVKKAEHWRIDAFELWCQRRLLRVPWTAKRSKQSILKEINPKCSLEKLMLKLKLQYFGHLMQRANSLEKTLMVGKIEGKRRRGQQKMRCFGWHHRLNGHEFEQTPRDSEGQGSLECCHSWGPRVRDNWATTKAKI